EARNVFYWHLGKTEQDVIERFSKVNLAIVGVNYISRQLGSSLLACGHHNFHIIDHPLHRNLGLFHEDGMVNDHEWSSELPRPQRWREGRQCTLGDCLVGTSDLGGLSAMCSWNNLCLDRKINFMPVILKNMIGFIGPLIIPGETACYECFCS